MRIHLDLGNNRRKGRQQPRLTELPCSIALASLSSLVLLLMLNDVVVVVVVVVDLLKHMHLENDHDVVELDLMK